MFAFDRRLCQREGKDSIAKSKTPSALLLSSSVELERVMIVTAEESIGSTGETQA